MAIDKTNPASDAPSAPEQVSRRAGRSLAVSVGCCVALLPSTSADATLSPAKVASDSANLTVTVVAAEPAASTGDVGVVRVRVRNHGPDAAQDTQVSLSVRGFDDPLPYLTLEPSQGSCALVTASGGACTLGAVAPQSTVSLRVRIPLTSPGSKSVVVAASSPTPDPSGDEGGHDGMTVAGDACSVVGTAGPDTLTGTSGPDVLCGFDSTDQLAGMAGADQILGGPAGDVADYGSAPAGVSVSLEDQLALDGTGTDILRSIRSIAGSAFGDTLVGSEVRNVLHGRGGPDSLFGRAGNDALFGGDGVDDLDGEAGIDRCLTGPGFDPAALNCEDQTRAHR